MPLGMQLDPSNRWVQKAHTIPWDRIEVKYAEHFIDSKTGNVAKPLQLMLGASIIKTTRRISDEETALQIQESPCLQYFCGLPKYTDELPFDPSSLTKFRNRLTPEFMSEINEFLIESNSNDDLIDKFQISFDKSELLTLGFSDFT